MSETKIRSFIAVELSTEAREEISRILEELGKAKADVKWVKPETIHLTLKFLGYIEEGKILQIKERLTEICKNFFPFDIVLENIGTFPSWNNPQVLWIGVGEGKENVKRLAKEAEKVMALEGFEKESRDFKAHITVGRIKSPRNTKRLQKLGNDIRVQPIKSHIDKVVLYKSDLSEEGAIHTAIAQIELR